MRRVFADVLKGGGVNIEKEYYRLYDAFYDRRIGLHNSCAGCFMEMPFRQTCVSLRDFDESFDYHFEIIPVEIDLDCLINFCEYSYNLVLYIPDFGAHNYGPRVWPCAPRYCLNWESRA